MLITLPGPGSNAPPAEALPSTPNAAVKPESDPATTSALPLVKGAPSAEPAPVEAAPSSPDVEAAPPVDEASSTQPEAVRAEPALPEAKSPEESPANQGLKFDGFFRPPAGTATRGTPRRTTTQSNTQR